MNVLRIFVAGAAVGTGLWAFQHWSSIGRALGPSCTVGVSGTAATLTIKGWTAPFVCNDLQQQVQGIIYAAAGDAANPIICQYVIQGDRFTVKDQGVLKLVGAAMCLSLSQQANGQVVGNDLAAVPGWPLSQPSGRSAAPVSTPSPDAHATAVAAQERLQAAQQDATAQALDLAAAATAQAERQAQEQVAQATAVAEARTVARAQAVSQLDDLAATLSDRLSSLTGHQADLAADLAETRTALKGEQDAIDLMKQHLALEQQDAALRPMTCYQAQGKVGYDYEGTLGYDYQGTFAYQRQQLAEMAKRVASDLASAQEDVTTIQAAEQRVQAAATVVPAPVPTVQPSAADARAATASYFAAAQAASRELTLAKAADAKNQSAADALMAQGKQVLASATALVTCS